MEMYLMGIDIGTTGTKVMIFNMKGDMEGSEYREYKSTIAKTGWVEIDGNQLVNMTFEACRELIKKSGINPERIVAVSFSTQRSSVGFTDKNGELLNGVLYSWQDNRAVEEVDFQKSRLSVEEIMSITGIPVTPTYAVAKILWVKKNLPDVYNSTKTIVLVHDLILQRFGADDFYCDWSNAGCTGIYNIVDNTWSKKLVDAFELDGCKLAKLVAPGTKLGYVSEKVSRFTGLSTKTVLCAGAGDQQCGVLGAGAVKEGLGTMTIGTAGFLISFLEKPATGKKFMNMMSVGSGVPGKYEIEGIQLGSGSTYRWFRDTFGTLEKMVGEQTGIDPYLILEEYVKKSPVGANGLVLLPYLGAAGCPHWNVHAKGVLAGVTFAHNKSDIARAFMEGIIFEMRDIFEAMKEAGVNFKELIITGGATKSPTWRQIMADILGVKIKRLAVSDATVLGAAILGGYGAGIFSSVTEGAGKLVKYGEAVEPIKDNVKKYNDSYSVYVDMYKALNNENIFEKLSSLQETR